MEDHVFYPGAVIPIRIQFKGFDLADDAPENFYEGNCTVESYESRYDSFTSAGYVTGDQAVTRLIVLMKVEGTFTPFLNDQATFGGRSLRVNAWERISLDTIRVEALDAT